MDILSKEEFVKIMDEVKDVSMYHRSLNNFFRNKGVDGYIFQPDCVLSTLKLLHKIFKHADKDEWIEYFCYELDFGKKWKPKTVTGKNGEDIKLETAEDLYDLLQKNYSD